MPIHEQLTEHDVPNEQRVPNEMSNENLGPTDQSTSTFISSKIIQIPSGVLPNFSGEYMYRTGSQKFHNEKVFGVDTLLKINFFMYLINVIPRY